MKVKITAITICRLRHGKDNLGEKYNTYYVHYNICGKDTCWMESSDNVIPAIESLEVGEEINFPDKNYPLSILRFRDEDIKGLEVKK